MLRRKGRAQGAQPDEADEAQDQEAVPSELPPAPAPVSDRSAGPFDAAEIEDPSAYIDFGAVLVPMRPDISVGLEQDQSTQRFIGLTILRGAASLQLRVFAAPRSGGYWEQNRQLLLQQLAQMRAQGHEVEGSFGVEVHALVPTPPEQPGPQGPRVVRFVAVEGPRWLLRGAFTGEGADPATAAAIEEVFRSVVVARGEEAMPVGAMLMLRTPPTASALSEPQDSDSGGPTVESLEPGEHITEVR